MSIFSLGFIFQDVRNLSFAISCHLNIATEEGVQKLFVWRKLVRKKKVCNKNSGHEKG